MVSRPLVGPLDQRRQKCLEGRVVMRTTELTIELKFPKSHSALRAGQILGTGQTDLLLDELLQNRDEASSKIKEQVDVLTDPWGIEVENVELKDVVLPEDMKRVIGKQAEAERERRSVVIKALGEVEASDNLQKAAETLSRTPGALHLRTLNTLNDLSSDQSNTVIFAVPLEVLRAFEKIADSPK